MKNTFGRDIILHFLTSMLKKIIIISANTGSSLGYHEEEQPAMILRYKRQR